MGVKYFVEFGNFGFGFGVGDFSFDWGIFRFLWWVERGYFVGRVRELVMGFERNSSFGSGRWNRL